MGEDPELALPLPGRIRPGTEGAAQPPLVPAERGLGRPPLAVRPPAAAPLRPLAEPPDHPPPVRGLRPRPRGLIGMTADRTPRTSRPYRRWPAESNAAPASARSQATARDARARTGRSWGESLDGPVRTRAPARKWLVVSAATASAVHSRDEGVRPARSKTYRDVCRLSSPVASTAAVGWTPIGPRSAADGAARWTTASPFLAAGRPRSTASRGGAPCPARGRRGPRRSRRGTGRRPGNRSRGPS